MHMAFVMPAYMQRQYAKKETTIPMDPENKQAVDFLKALGLTEYESKALCSLFAHSDITASDVSQFSGIPVTKVYSVLDSLEGKGLVRYTPSRPKKYRPLEPDAVLDALMRKQEEKLQIIRECKDNVTALLDKFYKGSKEFTSARNRIWLEPTEEAVWEAVARDVSLARGVFRVVTNKSTWVKGFYKTKLIEAIIGSLNRGVRIYNLLPSSLLANPAALQKVPKDWLWIFAHDNFYNRAIDDSKMRNTFTITDEERVGLAISDPATGDLHSGIMLLDESVVRGTTDYFEKLWDEAAPVEGQLREAARKLLAGTK